MAEFKGEKLTLQNIADASVLSKNNKALIEYYNLLIFTKSGTIDTSDYNCYSFGGTKIAGDSSAKTVKLGKALKATGAGFGDNSLLSKLVMVADTPVSTTNGVHTVEKIQIKSVRNFLGNQEIIKKINA